MASRLEECHFFLEECHSGVAGFVSGLQRAKPALPLYWLYSNAARPPVGTPQQAHAYVDDRGRRRRSSSFINKHDLGPHTSIPQSAHDQGNVFKRSSQSFEAHQQSKKKLKLWDKLQDYRLETLQICVGRRRIKRFYRILGHFGVLVHLRHRSE